MDFSTLLFGALLVALPLIGAGLLGTLIMLERPAPLSPAAANVAPTTVRRRTPRKVARRRR